MKDDNGDSLVSYPRKRTRNRPKRLKPKLLNNSYSSKDDQYRSIE